MNFLKLSVAGALLAIASIAAAEPYIFCELNGVVAPTAVASQYGVTLKDKTSDNCFALYEATSETQADSVRSSMLSNSSIVSAEVQTSATMPRTLTKKGSTIPVVGDRAAIQVQNQSLLSLINWSPTLAGSAGRSVRVAILDTGLADPQPALWSKVVASRNFVEPDMLAIDRPTGIDADHNGTADDAVGHGTMVASVIDAVAPGADLIIARVADSDGTVHPWNIVQGIRFAVENGAEVINLAFASPERNPAVARAIAYAERKGVLVVAGAGNDSSSDAYYPAKFPTVVAVSALDSNGTKTAFSNWHSRLDIGAPGFSVVGQDPGGTLAQWSGTSFASAFVSATVADCLRRRSPIAPEKIRRALEASGKNLNDANPTYRNKLGKLLDHAALNADLQTRN